MPYFGNASENQLKDCHADLQIIFREVVKKEDCSIKRGHRNKELQNQAYDEGRSQLRWPNGNHNELPSLAADVYPYPIRLPLWTDSIFTKEKKIRKFYHFAGYVKRTAEELLGAGKIFHVLRWGGDWDGDGDFTDQKFDDLVHFELRKIHG